MNYLKYTNSTPGSILWLHDIGNDWGICRTKLGEKEAILLGEAAFLKPLQRRFFALMIYMKY